MLCHSERVNAVDLPCGEPSAKNLVVQEADSLRPGSELALNAMKGHASLAPRRDGSLWADPLTLCVTIVTQGTLLI